MYLLLLAYHKIILRNKMTHKELTILDYLLQMIGCKDDTKAPDNSELFEGELTAVTSFHCFHIYI